MPRKESWDKSVEIIDKIIFSEKNQALLGDHVNRMREQGEDEDIINLADDFYEGICELHKEFMDTDIALKQDMDDKTVNHIKDIFKSQASVIKESN